MTARALPRAPRPSQQTRQGPACRARAEPSPPTTAASRPPRHLTTRRTWGARIGAPRGRAAPCPGPWRRAGTQRAPPHSTHSAQSRAPPRAAPSGSRPNATSAGSPRTPGQLWQLSPHTSTLASGASPRRRRPTGDRLALPLTRRIPLRAASRQRWRAAAAAARVAAQNDPGCTLPRLRGPFLPAAGSTLRRPRPQSAEAAVPIALRARSSSLRTRLARA
mmetsp:Transcript_16564/g.44632  ORF Transcript_16564/g.44632 Transcript_16564/m.44632 type:complete len:220 (+) Transcript_16564:545-1204(+)